VHWVCGKAASMRRARSFMTANVPPAVKTAGFPG